MALTNEAKKLCEELFGGQSALSETDPEFAEIFGNFAFDEVAGSDDLDEETRFLAVLASLVGCGGADVFARMLPAALRAGVKPVAVKEMLYQAAAYLGIGRLYPFLTAANDVLRACGVSLPLAGQGRVRREERLAAGERTQIEIFGEGMRGFSETGRETNGQVNKWLVDNCFGDYYTRGGLDFRQRELIAFCFLAAQGGCEPQLVSHAAANMRVGNGREFLIKVVSQCLPYIGYPRSLNALRCVNEAAKA